MIVHPYVEDWFARLDAWTIRSHRMAFKWGVHDCGLNAATAVEMQIGVDFAAELRGRYDSLEGGMALLAARGFADHAALAASVLPEIPPAFARIGDIAAVDFGPAGVALMVVAGQRLIGPMQGMAGNLSRMKACRAFAVGYEPDLSFPVRGDAAHRLLPDA